MAHVARIILSADDFALNESVSEAIGELAAQERLSATSALVTTAAWPRAADLVPQLRRTIAVGLHLNLTMGPPLGPMSMHARGSELPGVGRWIGWSLGNEIAHDEVAGEIDRQLDRFETVAGAPPDFIDGHHHVHVLPGVRRALATVVRRRYSKGSLLIRSPSDHLANILRRGIAVSKATFVAALASGFAPTMQQAGALTNRGFSGFSTFDRRTPYAIEFDGLLTAPGPFHIAMCHPGLTGQSTVDAERLSRRREEEFRTIAAWPALPDWLLHPAAARSADGQIDWAALGHR